MAEPDLWYRAVFAALNDMEHGINSLNALQHAAPTPELRDLALRAQEFMRGKGARG